MKAICIALLAAAAHLANCQLPPPASQDTAWNSTFTLSAAQKQLGQLTDELASQIETVYRWDQTQLANGGTTQDEFYNLLVGSMNAHPTKPGEILKVEDITDIAPFNLPAEVSMSRIIYTSVNLNGTLVPASGYILWPLLLSSGTTEPEAGYAVIAPDYAGLGVNASWDGTFVPHQYLAREASAKDSLNMIRAVRSAFPCRITSDYVVVGHSQGGAVSWGVSEVLAQYRSEFLDVYSGHLGTLMFAPAVDSILTHEFLFYPLLSRFMKGIFPTFNPSDWLTPLGIARAQLVSDLQAAQFVVEYAVATVPVPIQSSRQMSPSTHSTLPATSSHRSLFYGDIIPFTLAQAGYVVIATDYAGLGVEKSWDGSFVPHQYGAREANAGDALNALRAVRTTFSDRITDDYVVVGHSQGGAVSWGVSEVLAKDDQQYCDVEKGHLGTLTFAPWINVIPEHPQFFLPLIGKFLSGVFPTFMLSDWLTPLGGQYFSEFLFSNATEVVNPDWDSSYYVDVFSKLGNPGNRPYKGPMLIIQGTADPGALYNITLATYDSTCKTYPGDLELMTVAGAGHFPAIDASRQVWLKWIEDRFEGGPVESKGCVKSALESFWPVEQYQEATRSYFQWSGAPSWFAQLPVGSV
ncbi:Alpha/Beta hydrolase protein [Lipomyces doorenjongii]